MAVSGITPGQQITDWSHLPKEWDPDIWTKAYPSIVKHFENPETKAKAMYGDFPTFAKYHYSYWGNEKEWEDAYKKFGPQPKPDDDTTPDENGPTPSYSPGDYIKSDYNVDMGQAPYSEQISYGTDWLDRILKAQYGMWEEYKPVIDKTIASQLGAKDQAELLRAKELLLQGYSPTGERLTEEQIRAGLTSIEAAERQLMSSYLARQDAALKGEVPISPALEKELAKKRSALTESLARKLGPNWETSTSGIQALRAFDESAELLREEARNQIINTGQSNIASASATELARRGQTLAELGEADTTTQNMLATMMGMPSMLAPATSTASAYLSPYTQLQNTWMTGEYNKLANIISGDYGLARTGLAGEYDLAGRKVTGEYGLKQTQLAGDLNYRVAQLNAATQLQTVMLQFQQALAAQSLANQGAQTSSLYGIFGSVLGSIFKSDWFGGVLKGLGSWFSEFFKGLGGSGGDALSAILS